MENKIMKHVAKTLAARMIRRDMNKWPPDCFGITYQPVRPMRKDKQANQSESGHKVEQS